MDWHGYILLEKPAAMPMNAWNNALNGLLQPLDKSPNDPQPARRLHTRTSLDGTKVIVESVFPEGRINAIQNNQAKVTRWAFGGEWMGSREEVLAFLRANQSEWEEAV
jgi:hypothetical protein